MTRTQTEWRPDGSSNEVRHPLRYRSAGVNSQPHEKRRVDDGCTMQETTKTDLIEQNVHVTAELRDVLEQSNELRQIFYQLRRSYEEDRDLCCPCTYGSLRLMIGEACVQASRTKSKYEATGRRARKEARGVVVRLLEEAKSISETGHAIIELDSEREGLKRLSKKEVKRDLEQKQATLGLEKMAILQMNNLLQELERLEVEVDSPYCPNCLENMPASEARLKKNRCTNCFDCPVCGHTLMTRATSQMVSNPEDPGKSTPRKMYYMACGFCRWTTRDVGLQDQSVANGGWPEQENPNGKKIAALLESYRAVAQREKAERERKKYVKRRTHQTFQDKYGLTSVAMKWKLQPTMANLSLKENQKMPEPPEMTEPVVDFDPLPPETFTEPVYLEQITHLNHRLAAPEFQCPATAGLRPIHKHLLVRRSLRCRECEHNLSKPDFNPLSIKFKIQLVALNHIPELRILAPATFTPNKETVVTFTLSNPSGFSTLVKLAPVDDETDTDFMTAKIDLPKSDLMLAPHDDTAVYDDSSKAQQDFKDDPKVIVFRRANKIGFAAKVTPFVQHGEVKVSFIMKHEFRNTAVAVQAEDKEPKLVWLEHRVFVLLGSLHHSHGVQV